MTPLHSSRAGGTKLLNALFMAVPCLGLVFGLEALSTSSRATVDIWITIVTLVLTLAFIRVILPDRYDVYADRLRLVFPLFGWNIDFDTLDEVRLPRWWEPFAATGWRFATSPGQALVLQRRRQRWLTNTIVISPHEREEFLAAFRPIFEAYKQAHR